MLRDSPTEFGAVTKTLHWLMVVALLAMFALGLTANELAETLRTPGKALTESLATRTALLFTLHKTLGIAVLLLALIRLAWALSQHRPNPLHPQRRLETFLARSTQALLYGCMILSPIAGWIEHAATAGFAPIAWPLGQDLPLVTKSDTVAFAFGALHRGLVWTLGIAILLHFAAALKHHILDRDQTLRRMLPGRSNAAAPGPLPPSRLPIAAAGLVLAMVAALSLASQAKDSSEARLPQGALSAGNWTVTEGTLSIAVKQLGRRVEGSFDDWTAEIAFDDSATPGPAGRVNVRIATGTLALGSLTQQALGPDFLDAIRFPEASFDGTIERLETGYAATGPLVIRDQSLTVTLPFTLEIDEDTATMTGHLTVDRLDFGIGSALPDEGTLAYSVEIGVSLTARKSVN